MESGLQRRKQRQIPRKKTKMHVTNMHVTTTTNPNGASESNITASAETKKSGAEGSISRLIQWNEDTMLNFVSQVNKLYLDTLQKPAPFMTFVLCGMQSSGKSTIMERFLGSVLNIVQEGTGTRCPLDITCIHDESAFSPVCDLRGKELKCGGGQNLNVDEVFSKITHHNKTLGARDVFSTEPLHLEYRSRNVQNMRFVDTPGIITTQGTGSDNREDIKSILRSELSKPNTKLCILLEPNEFENNAVINFCDESFNGRDKWISSAVFVMNKFDKQFGDSRSASRANAFFAKYHENMIYPYLVHTPTLAKEDLEPDELLQERRSNLEKANKAEKFLFDEWQESHRQFKASRSTEHEADLLDCISKRIGFPAAKEKMRAIMLEDTVDRIPEVIMELNSELSKYRKEVTSIEMQLEFTDPVKIQGVAVKFASQLSTRIKDYLDGDMRVAMKFPEKLQTLEDEITDEEDSDWCDRELNYHTKDEDKWRDWIANLEAPNDIQPCSKFLGGKQYQRALLLFHAVLVGTFPDPFSLQAYASTSTGFLAGGLQRENWERAMTQITKACLEDITHPGINYLVKHTGFILRRLFSVALDDIQKGEELSSTFALMPKAVEILFKTEFDSMLWGLMVKTADLTHLLTEAKYSTVNTLIPNFDSRSLNTKILNRDQPTWTAAAIPTASPIMAPLNVKMLLRRNSLDRKTRKKTFLSNDRTAMVTDDELKDILQCSYLYILSLMELLELDFSFQLNHFLYQAFKEEITKTFMNALATADWKELVKPEDNRLELQLVDVNSKIVALEKSLADAMSIQGNLIDPCMTYVMSV